MAKTNFFFTCLNPQCRKEFAAQLDIPLNDADTFELLNEIIKKRDNIHCPDCKNDKFKQNGIQTAIKNSKQ